MNKHEIQNHATLLDDRHDGSRCGSQTARRLEAGHVGLDRRGELTGLHFPYASTS
jgi:hypothetical protein